MRFPILWLGLAVLLVEGTVAPRAMAQVEGAMPQVEGESPVSEAEALMSEGDRLFGEVLQLWQTSQYQPALEKLEQALEIYRNPEVRAAFPQESRQGEGRSLTGLGAISRSFGQYEPALDYYQQALAINQEIGDRQGEGVTLNNIGLVYDNLGQYQPALDTYQQALAIRQEIGDRNGEGTTLNNIGAVYDNLGQYQRALDTYQQALAILQEIGDRKVEGVTLNNIGLVYDNLGQYQRALDTYQQALAIRQEIGDRAGEGATLNNIGAVYQSLGQYQRALATYQQALAIRQEIGDRAGEGATLNNIGAVYQSLGQYQRALATYQQALAIRQEIGDRNGEGTTLNNIGLVYRNLGQYQPALDTYQQALAIRQEIGDRNGEGTTLNNIGAVYDTLGQYQRALATYQQALAIRQEIGDRNGEGTTLNNIGAVYDTLGQYQRALATYQQALVILQEIGDRKVEGVTLNNIGLVYRNLGQYQPALDTYQQALAIFQEIGDRAGEGRTLNNIGYVLESLEQPELAILFLKQSVNQYEEIRGEIRGLPTEQQQSFTDTVEGTYRKLADLLLQADRILEAQRVLDLLKVQELEDYLEDVQRNGNTAQGIPNRPPEANIEDTLTSRLNQVITLSRQLKEIEDIPTGDRTPTQQEQIIALRRQSRQLIEGFNDFLQSPNVQDQVALLRQTTDNESLDLSNYQDLKDSLAALNQNAVLLYPFVLEDRLELVLVTPDARIPLRETVDVGRVELNEAIAAYRSALEDPSSDPLPLAQKLYGWLLEPLADELETLNAETLIYAPDGQLRYIPLGALHDGDQWVVQDFRINNITAASLTDIALKERREEPLVFAGAFTEGSYPITVGDQQQTFTGLKFAGQEVENLATLLPETTQVLNANFHPDTIYQMNDYSIVHLATHATFVPGDASQSFILFGDGTPVSLVDVKSWELPNVDLIVLSACETGVGDTLGDGREILGLGYQMQRTGADAAIASLWSVSDGGTQVLMDAFYAALNNGYSATESLQRSQQALITGDQTVLEGERGVEVEIIDARTGEPLAQSGELTHPYYWAPFIVIGNGL